eukprot:gene10958-11040_t
MNEAGTSVFALGAASAYGLADCAGQAFLMNRISAWRVLKLPLRLLQFLGFNLQQFQSLPNYTRYRREYRNFENLGGTVTHRYPILTEYGEAAGMAKGHYFHQDLLVASLIFQDRPARHVDIGSRIDGFVAHVAAFRPIEIIDIRPLKESGHRNITFLQADLMDSDSARHGITESLSCLNAIEHFGLGRYGDTVDPNGHLKGFENMVAMLKPDGVFYISFPIGRQNEVHFNAHRVFHPQDVLSWVKHPESLELIRFDYIDDAGDLHQNVDLETAGVDVVFGCGIYTFRNTRRGP